MLVLVAWLAAAELAQASPTSQPAPSPSVSQALTTSTPPEVDELVVRPPEASEPDWSNELNFDVRGEYAPSDTPYLRGRPVDGCKLMAGGATSFIDQPGAAAGIVCAMRF